jgi:hypothetical protein
MNGCNEHFNRGNKQKISEFGFYPNSLPPTTLFQEPPQSPQQQERNEGRRSRKRIKFYNEVEPDDDRTSVRTFLCRCVADISTIDDRSGGRITTIATTTGTTATCRSTTTSEIASSDQGSNQSSNESSNESSDETADETADESSNEKANGRTDAHHSM